jgi:hypothetical protein
MNETRWNGSRGFSRSKAALSMIAVLLVGVAIRPSMLPRLTDGGFHIVSQDDEL